LGPQRVFRGRRDCTLSYFFSQQKEFSRRPHHELRNPKPKRHPALYFNLWGGRSFYSSALVRVNGVIEGWSQTRRCIFLIEFLTSQSATHPAPYIRNPSTPLDVPPSSPVGPQRLCFFSARSSGPISLFRFPQVLFFFSIFETLPQKLALAVTWGSMEKLMCLPLLSPLFPVPPLRGPSD